jgi:hypothetical protein
VAGWEADWDVQPAFELGVKLFAEATFQVAKKRSCTLLDTASFEQLGKTCTLAGTKLYVKGPCRGNFPLNATWKAGQTREHFPSFYSGLAPL